jgi:ribosome-associated translation inhibitor RaiA
MGVFVVQNITKMDINKKYWTTTSSDQGKVETPSYYDGKNNYKAIDVVTNFDLNYNLGTACTYILRAYKKHESPNEDIQKAIDHLNFELNKLKNQ